MPETEEFPPFSVQDAGDYYTITGLVPGLVFQKPAWGVLDEKDGGYIAFTTDEEQAERIVRALTTTEGDHHGST